MDEKQGLSAWKSEDSTEQIHLTLEERAAVYGGRLGPYEEFDWGEPVGRELW